MKQVGYFINLAAAICAITLATISVCNPKPNEWNLLYWLLALFTAGRLLCVHRVRPYPGGVSGGWRILLAAVAVFSLTMLTTQLLVRNPVQMALKDRIVIAVLAIVGITSAYYAAR